MLNVEIRTVPEAEQRYDTLGDWQWEGGKLVIAVTEATDWREEALVAVHELVEALLCRHRNIDQGAVDAFDFVFKGKGEPGDDPNAPYRREHRFAMLIEHLMAHEMGLKGYGSVE